MIRLASDQNFNHDILRGLQRRLPLVGIRSTQEAGLSQAEDPAVLEWAASEGRILLTHDRSTMSDYAY
jgi:predicted nuclease of predicted toxin-antitoxin system